MIQKILWKFSENSRGKREEYSSFSSKILSRWEFECVQNFCQLFWQVQWLILHCEPVRPSCSPGIFMNFPWNLRWVMSPRSWGREWGVRRECSDSFFSSGRWLQGRPASQINLSDRGWSRSKTRIDSELNQNCCQSNSHRTIDQRDEKVASLRVPPPFSGQWMRPFFVWWSGWNSLIGIQTCHERYYRQTLVLEESEHWSAVENISQST